MTADIATSLKDWSATAGSNQPDNSDPIGPNILAENQRTIQAVVRAALAGDDTIASATTTDIGAKDANYLAVSGTTTITGLGTVSAGIVKILKFGGILTFTHNGTSLILPTGANITTAAGDIAVMRSEGAGNWRCLIYVRASGVPLATTGLAASGANSDITSLAGITGLVNLSNASAGQIKFPSTQNASADANTLDDYREFTWTPVPTNLTVVGTPTYTGTGTKIGNFVYLYLSAASTTSTASTANTTTWAGNPYSPARVSVNSAVNGNCVSLGNGFVFTNGVIYSPTWGAAAAVYLDSTFTV